MKRLKNKAGTKVQVRQIKSANGRGPVVHKTLGALGLGSIGKQKTFTISPSLSGMIGSVSYLLDIKEVK
jgi:ribosomal protein L30